MKHDMQLTSAQLEGKLSDDYITTNRSKRKEHIISPLGALFVMLSLIGLMAMFTLEGTYNHYLTTSYVIICLVVFYKAFEYPIVRKVNK